MRRRNRKHWVRARDPRARTREELLEIGRALFDAITVDRLLDEAEPPTDDDDTERDDHDDRARADRARADRDPDDH